MSKYTKKNKKDKRYIPCTPGDSMLFDLESKTKTEAIKKLMEAASHMPYKTWMDFRRRGYTIEEV